MDLDLGTLQQIRDRRGIHAGFGADTEGIGFHYAGADLCGRSGSSHHGGRQCGQDSRLAQ